MALFPFCGKIELVRTVLNVLARALKAESGMFLRSSFGIPSTPGDLPFLLRLIADFTSKEEIVGGAAPEEDLIALKQLFIVVFSFSSRVS